VTDPDETQAAPDLDDRTEQSMEVSQGEAEAHEAASTWSQDDPDDIAPYNRHRSVPQRMREAAGLSLVLVMLLGGTVVTLINITKHPTRPPVQPPVKPVKGPIDGTYRVDRYRGEGTTRMPDGTVSAPAPNNGIVETEWWAFQSACPPPSCIAAGTRLDNTTHTQIAARLAPGIGENEKTRSLRLVNGQWVSDPPNRVPQDCAAGMPGHDMRRFTMELVQLADGTFKGQESDLVESNECGGAGTVVTTPIVATRVGDLPNGLPPLKTK
jgi:serine/threonine-protein kinase